MTAVFEIDGVACRACGAVRARRADCPIPQICESCWRRFRYFCSAKKPKEIERAFNKWLARKVILDLKRLERTGTLGRCEAVSDWFYGGGAYQCAHPATSERDGYLVCTRHSKVRDPSYIGDHHRNDPYVVLEMLLRRLINGDPKLAAAVRRSIDVAELPSVDLS